MYVVCVLGGGGVCMCEYVVCVCVCVCVCVTNTLLLHCTTTSFSSLFHFTSTLSTLILFA